MMRFFRKTKGAVSLFLTIILLPTLTVAGLFVDISRIKLAQEVTNSSADLALSTTLSFYDKKLKDYFGLMGECQNSDQAIALSKQFYQECMVSSGVHTLELDEYFTNIKNTVWPEDVRDALQLSVDGDVNITPTPNGDLANPAVLKYEILEFMKYRAPVNGVISLFEKLNDQKVKERAEAASKEAELMEAKEAFYEAKQKLYEDGEAAYNKIKEYEQKTGWTGEKISSENYFTGLTNFFKDPKQDGSNKSLRDIYWDAHQKIVKDIYTTNDGLGGYEKGMFSEDYMLKPAGIDLNGVENDSAYKDKYNESKKANTSDISKALTAYNRAATNFEKTRDKLEEAWFGTENKNGFIDDYGRFDGSKYAIQYWMKMSNQNYNHGIKSAYKNTYADYAITAQLLYGSYLVLQQAHDNPGDKVDMTDEDKPYLKAEKALQSYNDNNYDEWINPSSGAFSRTAFYEITNTVNQLYTSENVQKCQSSQLDYLFGAKDDANREKNSINGKIVLYSKDFDSICGNKGCLTEAKKLVGKLEKDIKDYNEKLQAWKKIAYDEKLKESDLAKQDKEEIKALERDKLDIEVQDARDLQDRISKVLDLFKSLKGDLDSIKYGGAYENGNEKSVALSELKMYTYVHHKTLFPVSKIPVNTNDLDQYVKDHFVFKINKCIMNIKISGSNGSWSKNDSGYTISKNAFSLKSNPENKVVKWMKKEFENKKTAPPVNKDESGLDYDVNDKSSSKDAKKQTKEAGDTDSEKNAAEGTSNKFKDWKTWSGEGGTPTALPSSGIDKDDESMKTKLKDAGKFAGQLFSNFGDTFGAAATATRDDLYMLDYLFEMFTYQTFDYEGCYDLIEDKGNLNVGNAETELKKVLKDWRESKENKTLTLTPRTPEHNWAHNGEIEYILYGQDTNSANKTKANTRIYLLRFIFNLTPVYQRYWNDDPVIEGLARALEAFAFIPAPLTKALCILAISAAEAAYDLKAITLGLPVIVLKDKDDIVCDYKTAFSSTASGGKFDDSDDKFRMKYSDYLKIFVFIKLMGSSENAVYARTADVIQANMTLETKNRQFQMRSSYTHFDLTAKVLVNPMWTKMMSIYKMGDQISEKNWRTIDVKVTRGY